MNRSLMVALSFVSGTAAVAGQSVFRSGTSQVTVSASVRQGNNVVAGLKAEDFVLTDNGVPQRVEALAVEPIPLDVTLFLDTSGSTSGRLDEMKKDVQGIANLLRPDDRFRLLVIGDSVVEAVSWVAAGTKLSLPFEPVGGISLVQDALLMAMLHRVEPARRHLVVGMTDSHDCGSVVTSAALNELAARSEAVVHIVDQSGSAGEASYRVRTCSPRARQDGPELIESAVNKTGGEVHRSHWFFRSASILGNFKKIFEDFRSSYVLRYSPEGVAATGWHGITVTVPKKNKATVRARAGYYGS